MPEEVVESATRHRHARPPICRQKLPLFELPIVVCIRGPEEAEEVPLGVIHKAPEF